MAMSGAGTAKTTVTNAMPMAAVEAVPLQLHSGSIAFWQGQSPNFVPDLKLISEAPDL
jgi:hypothetical protein